MLEGLHQNFWFGAGEPEIDALLAQCLFQGLHVGPGVLTAATLMRSWGVTLWTFWQNTAQLSIYGTQADTLVDNAGVIQTFGAKNPRMAQDFANIVGGISAEQIMKMRPDEQILLIDGKITPCKQLRYYSGELFRSAQRSPAR